MTTCYMLLNLRIPLVRTIYVQSTALRRRNQYTWQEWMSTSYARVL